MTIGIYALYWEKQDLIYIGQSQNIEERYREHLYKMRHNKHTNYKVQRTFTQYNEPELLIIECCNLSSLNDKEIFWTEEFNSIKQGLNIIEAGKVGHGVNSNASKYSKITILKIFRLLANSNLSYKDISDKLEVNYALVKDIVLKNSHLWLWNKYPYHGCKIINKKENRARHTKYRYNPIILISPTGIKYSVESIKEFCEEVILPQSKTTIKHIIKGISRLINNNTTTYLGWKLYH